MPPFPGLRRFPDGRDFTQWTGGDSKALMKVYVAAIAGHVPSEMVKCVSAFLDFCYIARRNALTSKDLKDLEDALTCFHRHREVFVGTAGVNKDRISLPQQHSLTHYFRSIRLFGSPNGLCSSITESKHIKSVKEPWRRSSRYRALKQMLTINSRLDKLASACRVFDRLGMMEGTTTSYTAMILRGRLPKPKALADDDNNNDDDDIVPVNGPKSMSSIELARIAGMLHLTCLYFTKFPLLSQNEIIRGGLKILLFTLVSQSFWRPSTAFSTTGSIPTPIFHPQRSISRIVRISSIQSMCTTLLLLVFTPQAIFVVQAGCAENISARIQTGMESTPGMILCS